MSADCRAANLFDPRASIGSGVGTNLTYHSGSVSGEIMWEAVTLSTFSIAYQAFGMSNTTGSPSSQADGQLRVQVWSTKIWMEGSILASLV